MLSFAASGALAAAWVLLPLVSGEDTGTLIMDMIALRAINLDSTPYKDDAPEQKFMPSVNV